MAESNVTTSISSISTELKETDENGAEVYNPNFDNWHRNFWRSVVSSENGTGSTARVGTLSIIWISLGIVSYLVILTHAIPDKIMDLGYYSVLLIIAVYSPAKILEIFRSYFGKK